MGTIANKQSDRPPEVSGHFYKNANEWLKKENWPSPVLPVETKDGHRTLTYEDYLKQQLDSRYMVLENEFRIQLGSKITSGVDTVTAERVLGLLNSARKELDKPNPNFGKRDLASISQEEVLEFLLALTKTNKQATKRNRYSVLASFYNFIINTNLPSLTNPCNTAVIKKIFKRPQSNPVEYRR